MITIFYIMVAVCIIGFVLVVTIGLCHKDKDKEQDNDAAKQLNEWQDRDILED